MATVAVVAVVAWAAWAAWICKTFWSLWHVEKPRFDGAFLFDSSTMVNDFPLHAVQVCCTRDAA